MFTFRSRRGIVAALASAALILTAACGGSDDGGDDEASGGDPFQIVYISGITGLLAPSAKAIRRGIEAKIDAINDAGGINGRKVELTVHDNQSDPTRGATIIQKELSGSKKPDLLIPGVSSNEALAAAPLLARNKVVGLNSISSPVLDDVTKFPYTFSESMTTTDIVGAGLQFILDKGNVKKIALIVPNDAIGDATAGAFDKFLEGKGIDKTEVRFPGDGLDYSPAFQKAVAAKPDWIFMDGAGTQAANLLTSRVKASAEDIPTLAGVVASSQPLLDLAKGDELTNLYATVNPAGAYVEPGDRDEEFQDFIDRLNEQGKLEVPLSTYAAGWDYVGIWENAVKTIKGEVTGEKLKEALETTPPPTGTTFPLYSGAYSKDSHFHPGDVKDFTFGTPIEVKDGMYVVKTD